MYGKMSISVQQKSEIKMPSKKILKDFINYALLMKQKTPESISACPLKRHVHRHLYKFDGVCAFFSGYVIVVVNAHLDYVRQIIKADHQGRCLIRRTLFALLLKVPESLLVVEVLNVSILYSRNDLSARVPYS